MTVLRRVTPLCGVNAGPTDIRAGTRSSGGFNTSILFAMPIDLNKVALWMTAIAILSYAAFVYYDCSHDESCHVVYCGARHRPCGLSHAPQEAPSTR